MMKTLLSAVTAVALLVSAGAAMAQEDQEHHPARHHHARAHRDHAMHEARDDGMRGERTEHGGPPSSESERAQTERLNAQQLGGPGQSR
jgi:Ni/Co efflux regulator RcnB